MAIFTPTWGNMCLMVTSDQGIVVSDASMAAFYTVAAQVIPILILAILVDSSRSAARIGRTKSPDAPDSESIRQSRRALVAVMVGGIGEIASLANVLTTPSDSSINIPRIDYWICAGVSTAILVLFYVLFIPHVELHISIMRNHAGNAYWTLAVGWFSVTFLIIVFVVLETFAMSRVNRILGFAYLGFALILSGAMITLTVSTIRRR